MKAFKYLSILLAFSLTLSACKKEDEENCDPVTDGSLRVNVTSYFNNEAFAVGNVYTNTNGYRVRVDDFKFYLSELYAIQSDGTEIELKDIDLINLVSGVESMSFILPDGDYSGIRFSIGVPEAFNKDQDPTQYPNDHPLSVNGAQGMFWTWNTGYIFMKVEGKADLEGEEGNDLLSPFAFHCGEDLLFRTHVFNNNAFSIQKGQVVDLDIRFDVDRFFYSQNDTIDIAIDNLTHTSGNPELAERFTELFNNAISVE